MVKKQLHIHRQINKPWFQGTWSSHFCFEYKFIYIMECNIKDTFNINHNLKDWKVETKIIAESPLRSFILYCVKII